LELLRERMDDRANILEPVSPAPRNISVPASHLGVSVATAEHHAAAARQSSRVLVEPTIQIYKSRIHEQHGFSHFPVIDGVRQRRAYWKLQVARYALPDRIAVAPEELIRDGELPPAGLVL